MKDLERTFKKIVSVSIFYSFQFAERSKASYRSHNAIPNERLVSTAHPYQSIVSAL